MSFVFNLLSEQSILAFLQMFVGKWIKNNPAITNKVIPWVTLLFSILGYTLMPVTAAAAGMLTPLAPVVGTVSGAIFQTLIVTGGHSWWKNSIAPALRLGAVELLRVFTRQVKPDGE